MKPFTRTFKTLLYTGLGALLLAGSVWAADLGTAKAQGLIGERPDGYLGLVVSSAPADVRALVDDVNAKRRARYQQIASQTNAPLSEVEKVGGMTAIDKTPRGQFVMDASGRWVRK